MKYTLEGYNQEVAIQLGLKLEDLAILRWFDDFLNTGKMQQFEVEGTIFYWIKYDYIIKQLPIIAEDKRKIATKLKRLVDLNILEFCLLKKNGTFSLYRLNEENHQKLTAKSTLPKDVNGSLKTCNPCIKNGERVTENMSTPITKNCQPRSPKTCKPYTENCQPNIPLSNITQSNNSSIKNKSNKNTTHVGDIENFVNASFDNQKVRQAVFDFIEHRQNINASMNDNVVKIFVDKLKKYSDDEKIELINNSIINGWKDIYPREKKSNIQVYEGTKSTSYDIAEADELLNTVPKLV